MGCMTSKEIWDKLKSIHEGDDKIKEAKLQTFTSQFEVLKMNDEEDIVGYMVKFNGIINSIQGLGENIEDKVIFKYILWSLSSKFDAKVSTIEEAKDLNTLTLDEMHGTLTSYEMRIGKSKIDDKEVIFRATKSLKPKAYLDEEDTSEYEEYKFFFETQKRTTQV